MNEIERLLAFTNLSITREQLQQWEEKKSNAKTRMMICMMSECEAYFRAMEKRWENDRGRLMDYLALSEKQAVELKAKDELITKLMDEVAHLTGEG